MLGGVALVRTQVQLTPDQMAALRVRAAKEERSVSDLIREAVDELLRSQPVAEGLARALRFLETPRYFGRERLADLHDSAFGDEV